MSNSDGRRANRPYRRASEYLATKQTIPDGPRTVSALERENAELREKLTLSVRRAETMEVEHSQSREYFSNQLDVTNDKLCRTTQALKVMQQSYSELQSINYELEQRILKVSELEQDRSQLTSDIYELTNKLTDARTSLQKIQKENERLRKDCNLAVSLLECNAGNFKQQRAKELPQDLQTRVEEYQMDLSQYNEYINPYADESDEEEDARQFHQPVDSVPTELLANILKKSENAHLHIEDTDYIRDPDLNSVYKGQIVERKLVKHDYGSATLHHTSDQNFTHIPKSASTGVQSSSPWELARTATSSGSSSPWEMSANPTPQSECDADDYGSASAYGAYPVMHRNHRQRKKSAPPHKTPVSEKRSEYNKSRMTSSYNAVTSHKSPTMRKGTGENQDVYISQNFAQDPEREPERTASNSSSKKSTPARIPTDAERGSSAEKSSLLDQGESDDEEVMTIEMGSKGPVIRNTRRNDYRTVGHENRGLLQDSDPEQDERELDVDYENEEADDLEVGLDDEERESSTYDDVPEKKIPEFDLLNLDEGAKIATDPLHHLMTQQGIADLGSMSASLLPDLPPPSEVKYDGELILCGEVPAPPPPDMFGGSVPMNFSSGLNFGTTPMQHPLVSSQTATVFSDAEPSSVASQVSSTNSLDDLKNIVRKEFESAQSPVKKPVAQVPSQNLNPDVSSSQTKLQTNEVESVEKRSEICSEPHDEPRKLVVNGGDDAEANSSDVVRTEDTLVKEQPEKDYEPAGDDSQEIESSKQESQDEDVKIPLPDRAKNNEDAPHDGSRELEVTYERHQTPEVVEVGEDVPHDNSRELMDGSLIPEDIDGLAQQYGRAIKVDDARHYEESDEISSSVALADAVDEEQTQTAKFDERFNSDSPLEVIELQEEPRGGGNYGRRRNSFDQAREYGNVMVD